MKILIGIIIGILLILNIRIAYAKTVEIEIADHFMTIVDSVPINGGRLDKIWDSKSKINCYVLSKAGYQNLQAVSCIK